MLKSSQNLTISYLVKQLPAPTVFIDRKYKIIHTSDKWISMFDQDRLNVFGKNLFKIHSGLSTKWTYVIEDCFNGNPNPMGVHKLTDNTGNSHWFEWAITPWFDTDENIIGAIIQMTNVTEAVDTELKFEKLNSVFQQQSEISKIGSWEYDLVQNTFHFSSMTQTIHELPTDHVTNIDEFIDFYTEGHSRNAISMALFKASHNQTPWNLKLQIKTAKGNIKWVITSGRPVFTKGILSGYSGTVQDVHEQEVSSMKTKASEKLLKTLIDNLPVNVYIKDLQSKRILVNKSESNFLGISDPMNIIGKTDYDFFPTDTANISRTEDLSVMETLKPIIGKETVCIRNDGSKTFFHTSKIPLLDKDGKANGMVGISLDITNLKQKEKELRELINVTSLQNKKLIHFAHIVSHNLRSHAANFSMLLDFLVHEENENEKTKIIEMLTGASNHLMETLDSLNEVVAVSSNQNMHRKKVPLFEKIEAVQDHLSEFLKDNQAQLQNFVDHTLTVNVVPSYLESILVNFITNAVKYSHPKRVPSIMLTAKKESGYTVLTIKDNGLGIDLKKYGKKLFGMYKTFHNHKDARGIGLYISKNQIEAMNGKITVQSKVDIGTSFNIYFNDGD